MLVFFVPGVPAPQGSKTIYRGRLVESSKKLKPWRAAVTDAAKRALDSTESNFLTGPVAVRYDFVLPRPKSLSKVRPTPPAVKRPDGDKLARSVSDSLTDAGVWGDDSQVTVLWATKRIAEVDEQTGVVIRIEVAR